MDRAVLESDPFFVLEGMLIAAYAIGASKGYIYCRAEYPLAVERLTDAIEQCRAWACWATTSWAACSRSTSPSSRARAPSCAAKKPPSWPASKVAAACPGRARRIPRSAACSASPRCSTTSRPWPTCRSSSTAAPSTFRISDSARRPAPRCSRFPAPSQHRPRRSSRRHQAAHHHRGHRRRRAARPQDQGRADRRSVGRLHSEQHLDTVTDYADAHPTRRHDGVGRHGGDGRTHLHGRRGSLLHGVHPQRILRQVHAVPRRHHAHAGDPDLHHRASGGRRGKAPRTLPRRAAPARAGQHGQGSLAVRARPIGGNPVLSTLRFFRDEYERT
jgi:hypothetical protein